MLEIRPTCENCNKLLPPDSKEAMICTFECTFCYECVTKLFHDVCPNCGGGFVQRPVRPVNLLKKYPATKEVTFKPVDMEAFKEKLEKNRGVRPEER